MKRRRLRVLWLLTLLALIGQLAGKAWNRHGYRAAKAADEDAFVAQKRARRAILLPIIKQLDQMSTDGLSRAAVAERLKGYVVRTRIDPSLFEFRDPQTGVRFNLVFIRDVLIFYSYETPDRPPFDDAGWHRFGKGIEWAGTIGLGACWFVALAALARGARPKSVATVVLAAAIVCGVACAQDPRPDGLLRDALQARLALATVAVCLLMIAFAPGRPPDPMACPHCRYDLTGNVSGICPECGTLAPVSVRRSAASTPTSSASAPP